MQTFLTSLIPASLFIFGVHILFQEGHIFEKQGRWLTNRLGEYWTKPLQNCPICMASLWGTLWVFFGLPLYFDIRYNLQTWPIYCLCLCGLNYLLNKLISKEVTVKSDV